MAKGTTGRTNFGGGFVFGQGAGSLWDVLDHTQAGTITMGPNETTSTGTFDKAFTSTPNHVSITPVINPSGYWYVSSLTTTGFVVTFSATPTGSKYGPGITTVANWFACM